jgi:hypothetical protein
MLRANLWRFSKRKLRLFACACASSEQLMGGLDLDPRQIAAVRVAEKFAEGRVSNARLRQARETAEVARVQHRDGDQIGLIHVAVTEGDAALAVRSVVEVITVTFAEMCVPCETYESARDRNSELIVRYLHEVLDGWWLPSVDRSPWLVWNEGTIPRLAETIYEERAFDRLPILADAIEDAGCNQPALLDHLRQGGKHVRGCWALDLILGRK